MCPLRRSPPPPQAAFLTGARAPTPRLNVVGSETCLLVERHGWKPFFKTQVVISRRILRQNKVYKRVLRGTPVSPHTARFLFRFLMLPFPVLSCSHGHGRGTGYGYRVRGARNTRAPEYSPPPSRPSDPLASSRRPLALSPLASLPLLSQG